MKKNLDGFVLENYKIPRLEEHNRGVIGARLRKLRIEKRLSQYVLGLLVGVSADTISSWECGERNIRTIYKMVFAHYFGVDERYLYDPAHKDRGSRSKVVFEEFVRSLDNEQRAHLHRILT